MVSCRSDGKLDAGYTGCLGGCDRHRRGRGCKRPFSGEGPPKGAKEIISGWWAHAIGDLGLSDYEFMRLTPGQFQVLSNRWIDAQKADMEERDVNTARICWSLFELQRDRKKHPQPFKLEDFMLQEKKKPKVQSPKEQTAILMQLFGGGKK